MRPGPSRIKLTAVAAAVLAGALTGCTDDGGAGDDVAAFCRLVEEELVGVESPIPALEGRDPDQLRASLQEADAAFDALVDAAPDDIVDDARVLRRVVDEVIGVLEEHDYDMAAANADLLESDLTTPQRIEELRAARDRVAGFSAERCNLPPPTTTTSVPPAQD